MSRTLQPQDEISHYRVLGPLGTGGMGEVYEARDRTLERSVALKVLPRSLVQDEERVRRFITEAKSASSLNHPHIITIYEIGQDTVRSEHGDLDETESSPVHFISMELVTGETLGQKIHDAKADLKTLLGYLSQAAEGVAKAHAAGIVHRDLKPANIMISKDGYAKVLDFGLAKLTEQQESEDSREDESGEPTALLDRTGEGKVLGTVGYMAPEQIRGKAVDHRADMFAFGCLLYEAATGTRPFAAETGVETMHMILHEQPKPVEALNPQCPTAVRRIIRRCLAKNPERRFQSMKDLALELREIVEEYDGLTASGTSAVTGISDAVAVPATRGMGLKLGFLALTIVGVAALAVGVRTVTDSRSPGAAAGRPFQSVRFTSLFSRPDLGSAVLSPDGRYLAYVDGSIARRNLKIRQVATGSEVTILSDQQLEPYGIQFSADGNYLYYLNRDVDDPAYRALYQVASLGGTPRKRLFDIDSGASFAPDGVRIVFRRGKPDVGRETLTIANLDSGQERELASVDIPRILLGPAWSPDGTTIAAIDAGGEDALDSTIVVFDVASGEKRVLGDTPWNSVQSLAWVPDGSAILATALEITSSRSMQVWYISYPEGRARMITNELDDYLDVGITGDGRAITTLRAARDANLWVAEASAGATPRQIRFGSGSGRVGKLSHAAGDVVLFEGLVDGLPHIWTAGLDGSGTRQLTSGKFAAAYPCWVPQGEFVVFARTVSDTNLEMHIWRVDLDGGNLRQLTSGSGEKLMDVSRDGKWIYFWTDAARGMFRVSVDGGKPEEFVATKGHEFKESPDGALMRYGSFEGAGDRLRTYLRVIPTGGGPPVAEYFQSADRYGSRWTPDGNGFSFSDRTDGGRSLYRSDLNEQDVERILGFEDGRIMSHDWSPDGTRIQIHRRIDSSDSLWIAPATGGSPQMIARFPTGQIWDYGWTADGRHILFSHGQVTRQVIQIREAARASN